jgi:hypothetical protein
MSLKPGNPEVLGEGSVGLDRDGRRSSFLTAASSSAELGKIAIEGDLRPLSGLSPRGPPGLMARRRVRRTEPQLQSGARQR